MKKLHLGCWKRYIPWFIHIDVQDYDHIDYNSNIDNLSMFEDNSINIIYACHVLEHFKRKEVKNVLKEWYRVLEKWWILRVSVPWFEEMLNIYNKYNDINLILWPLIWWQKNIYDFHYMLFDFKNISSLLKEAWFSIIKKYDWRDTEHSNIDDYSQSYIPHMDKENWLPVSLNIEAVK
jgi:predicted SAM-dependent methyltransferase